MSGLFLLLLEEPLAREELDAFLFLKTPFRCNAIYIPNVWAVKEVLVLEPTSVLAGKRRREVGPYKSFNIMGLSLLFLFLWKPTCMTTNVARCDCSVSTAGLKPGIMCSLTLEEFVVGLKTMLLWPVAEGRLSL